MIVSSLEHVNDAIVMFKPKTVISLIEGIVWKDDLNTDDIRHIVFNWADVNHENHPNTPTLDGIRSLIGAFELISAASEVGEPLLIHCHQGRNRSTAAALIYAYIKTKRDELELVKEFRAAMPHAVPNIRMIMLVDEVLGIDKALGRALIDTDIRLKPHYRTPIEWSI